MMDVSRTLKARLILNDANDYQKVFDTMLAFRGGCNYVSNYIFENGFPLNQIEIQKVIYQDVRKECSLKSMLSQSAIRATVSRYKTVKMQLSKQTVWGDYKKYSHGKDVKNFVKKDLMFLWKPIEFKRPQLDLV